MVWNGILNSLLYIAIDADVGAYSIVTSILYLVGLWKIFEKCGLKGWWALVPLARVYQLGRCADREQEGRTMTVLMGLLIVARICANFILSESTASEFFSVITLLISLGYGIYSIRVYLGLIEVFGESKWWILSWIIISSLTSLFWGFSKKSQPRWQVSDLEDDAADFFSGSKAAVLDQGLTVNLEERTATEFFRKKTLLRDIHMYIQPGHMVLLLGGSGAGKTTFVNAVNGYEPAKAEIMINGKNMYKNYKSMQYDIGFVPQLDLMRGSDSVFRTLTDAAALRLPSTFSKAEREARVNEVMEIFGLLPVKDNLVSKLSGGQRKRLSIAMEFISNPTLFILDEPDSGLDGVMARELFEQLRHIADQGKIIIVITHTPDRVIDLLADVIVLAKDARRTGRLAWFGPIAEARTFFGKEKMEEIVKAVNRTEEGGEGRADEFVLRYAEVQHG